MKIPFIGGPLNGKTVEFSAPCPYVTAVKKENSPYVIHGWDAICCSVAGTIKYRLEDDYVSESCVGPAYLID